MLSNHLLNLNIKGYNSVLHLYSVLIMVFVSYVHKIYTFIPPEAAAQICFVKKMFLKIPQSSQGNAFA